MMVSAVMATAQKTPAAPGFPDAAELNRMAARFAPTPLEVDTSTLSAGDKQALVKLIEATWDKSIAGSAASITSGSITARGRRSTATRRFSPKYPRTSRPAPTSIPKI